MTGKFTTKKMLAVAVLIGVLSALGLSSAVYADPTPAEVEKQIDEKATALEKVIEQYNGVKANLGKTRAQAEVLRKKLAPMQTQVDAMYTRVGKISAGAYKGSTASVLNALLSEGSPTVLIDQLATLDVLARKQRQEISALEVAKAGLDGEKAKVDKVVAQQQAQEKDLAGKKTKIEKEIVDLQALYTKVGGGPSTGNPGGPRPPYDGTLGSKAVQKAYDKLGADYVWAGEGPGYDCSGLTKAAWLEASGGAITLTHQSAAQMRETTSIDRSELKPGDLVFYGGSDPYHVAIYVGGGKIVHAPQQGDVVREASMDYTAPSSFGRPHK